MNFFLPHIIVSLIYYLYFYFFSYFYIFIIIINIIIITKSDYVINYMIFETLFG